MSAFFTKVRDADFTGLNRAFGRGKHSGNSVVGDEDDRGIRGGPQVASKSKKGFGKLGGGKAGVGGVAELDDDDTSTVQVAVRSLTVFLLLINIIIYAAIAVFQKNWNVGPSSLTGLALFVLVEAALHAIIFLAVPQIYERTDHLKGFARALRLTRVQLIVFGTQTALLLIMSVVATASAYTGGCKDPSQDDHADNQDYIAHLDGFCRNKRAAAAFWWLSFVSFGAMLGLTVRNWHSIRKLGPRHPTFIPPAGADDSAFDEEAGGDDDDAYSAVSSHIPPPGMGRPSNAGGYYGDRPLFDDNRPPPGYAPQARPAPPRQQSSLEYRIPEPQMASYQDPFDVIRQQIGMANRT